MKSNIEKLTAAGLLAAVLLAQIGCTESAQEMATEDPAMTSPIPAGMVRGTVIETMNAAGYTYVLIQSEQGQRWSASPMTAVKVGDIVQTDQGMPMADFSSKTLNRTFEVIYFVGVLENLSAPAGRMPVTPVAENTASSEVHVAALKEGENIAYLYANKDSLAGQQISLKGEVVKFNANILGTNFIHIQDGSGDAADGSNDLTVTSSTATAVGETIVVTGTVILSKDFGAGYNFPLLLEGASIVSE